jgi:hypothetical protein
LRSRCMGNCVQTCLIAVDSADVLAERGVRSQRQRTTRPEHCAGNAAKEHRFQEISFEVKSSRPGNETIASGKLGAHT